MHALEILFSQSAKRIFGAGSGGRFADDIETGIKSPAYRSGLLSPIGNLSGYSRVVHSCGCLLQQGDLPLCIYGCVELVTRCSMPCALYKADPGTQNRAQPIELL